MANEINVKSAARGLEALARGKVRLFEIPKNGYDDDESVNLARAKRKKIRGGDCGR